MTTNALQTGVGPYDFLYAARKDRSLWGLAPGRLVKNIELYLPKGSRILDAGCGDGKNSRFLDELGYRVTGVDVSLLAIQILLKSLTPVSKQSESSYVVGDVTTATFEHKFDCLVSYGLYHCLPPNTRLASHGRLMKNVVRGGIILFSTLTTDVPLPGGHGTPDVWLAEQREIDQLFEGWQILEDFRGLIHEHHMPVIGLHQHSARWIVARSCE